MSFLTFKQGEYGFRVTFTCKDCDGTVIDLTDTTPWMWIEDKTASSVYYSGQCTILSATDGTCYLSVPATATDTVGSYHGEIHIKYNTGNQEIIAQEFTVNIIP